MIPINSGRLLRQLAPTLGQEKADLLTVLVKGTCNVLTDNPILAEMLAPQTFAIIALMYGIARRACTEVIEDLKLPQEMRDIATAALSEMDRLHVLADTADPSPASPFSAGGMSIGDLIDEIVDSEVLPAPSPITPSAATDIQEPATPEDAGAIL